MTYLIGKDGYYVVEFISYIENEESISPQIDDKKELEVIFDDTNNYPTSKHVFHKSGPIYRSELDKDVSNIEDETDEEYTLFGKYSEGKISKCVSIDISSYATVNELRNAFSDVIGKKVMKMSNSVTPDEYIVGDHIVISAWPDLTNGCFLNIYF